MGAKLCVPLPRPRPQGRFGTWWAVPDPTQSGLALCDASVPPAKMESHYELLYTEGCLSSPAFLPTLRAAARSLPSLARPLLIQRPLSQTQGLGDSQHEAFSLGERSLTGSHLSPVLAGSLLRGGSVGTDPSPVVSLPPHLLLLPIHTHHQCSLRSRGKEQCLPSPPLPSQNMTGYGTVAGPQELG